MAYRACPTYNNHDPDRDTSETYWCNVGEIGISHKSSKLNCWEYKPRQNQCEADGCKWMVEEECTFGGYQTDWKLRGETECWHFKKQEETMETIEFNGKEYEAEGRIGLTLHNLFNDAKNCPDAIHAVWKFTQEFPHIQFYDDITLSKRVVKYLNQHPGIIPWLLDKGYIREVEEEKTYKVGQWIKPADSHPYLIIELPKKKVGLYYFLDGHLRPCNDAYWNIDIEALNERLRAWSGFKVIDPPLITEQLDTAERRPELCVHLSENDTCWCNVSIRCNRKCREGDADICGHHSLKNHDPR